MKLYSLLLELDSFSDSDAVREEPAAQQEGRWEN